MIILKNEEQKDWERNICSQYKLCKNKGLDGVLSIIENDYKELHKQILHEKLEKIHILKTILVYLDKLLFRTEKDSNSLRNIYNDLRYVKNQIYNLEKEYNELSTISPIT